MDYESASIDWDTDDHPLDHINVSQLTTEIKDLVIGHVDTILHTHERPQLALIEPILQQICRELFSPATLYALLASLFHFKQEAKTDASSAKLWTTRSTVCEELALSLVSEYDPTELAQGLLFEFYPLSDGSSIESLPTWFRVSAMELAIKGAAKRLIAHPMVIQVISEVWDGHLILDPLVHKVHRSENLKSKQDLQRLMNARRGVVVGYDFETTTIFKPSRLRVPKYRDWLKLLNLAIMVSLYVMTMGPSSSAVTEMLFQIWLFSFILDELQALGAVGGYLYFLTLWSLCDFATMCLGTLYFILIAWTYVSETPEAIRAAAYDVLAICGVTLIPRTFSVLEVSVGFSRTVISVRKMIIELIWCWIAITMFSVGFWAALAHFGKGKLTQTQVFYDLVQIMFGFTPAVWQTWHEYPTPGAMILFLYLFMAQFVVTTIVTAALSAKVVETKDNSLEEYHFLNAVKAEVRIKSERQVLYFYSQPFNILAFFPLSLLRAVLPTPWYLRVNRLVLKSTHWHIFLAIYAYEKLSSAIISRREKFTEIQQQRVAREVQGSISKRNSRYSRRRPSIDETTSIIDAVGSNRTRDAKFDLVEGLLNNQHQQREQQQRELFPATSHPSPISPQPGTSRSQRRLWSFSTDVADGSASISGLGGHINRDMASEHLLYLEDLVGDLQHSNAKLEAMLKQLLQKFEQN